MLKQSLEILLKNSTELKDHKDRYLRKKNNKLKMTETVILL